MIELSDDQWLVLDLLMRARQSGVPWINRLEMLHNTTLPQGVTIRLAWAALTMPTELVTWSGQHDFTITAQGVAFYNFRFDNREPTEIGGAVICLPGPDRDGPMM